MQLSELETQKSLSDVLPLYGFISPYGHLVIIDLRGPLLLQTLKETGIRSPQRCRQNGSHYWQTRYETASFTPFPHPHLPRFTSVRFAEPLYRSKRSPPPSNRAATFAVTMANTRSRCLDHDPTRLIGSWDPANRAPAPGALDPTIRGPCTRRLSVTGHRYRLHPGPQQTPQFTRIPHLLALCSRHSFRILFSHRHSLLPPPRTFLSKTTATTRSSQGGLQNSTKGLRTYHTPGRGFVHRSPSNLRRA